MLNQQIVRYGILGYTCELPVSAVFQSVEISPSGYAVHTPTNIINLKPCRKCKRLLPLDAFYERKSPCKECHKFLVRSWQKRNPETVKEHKRKCNRNYRIKQKLKNAGLE